MTVTLLQHDTIWANPLANHEAADRMLADAPQSDLYVLPEMWSTGFATDPADIAETSPSGNDDDFASLTWMRDTANRLDAAIAGSIAVCLSDGTYRNRLYFVKPGGEAEYYDKRHLFTYGGEHKRYTAGAERKIVEWRGVRFLLQVCYDLRFPMFSRNIVVPSTGDAAGSAAYDCAIYVASWPTPRVSVWKLLVRARAVENQCYVLAVNRTGEDPVCKYSGGTAVIDAYGKTVAEQEDGMAGWITAELDMDRLNAFRRKFPVLDDADKINIEL